MAQADQTRKIRLIMHLRAQGVQDTGVLAAIERIPREHFIPPHFQDQAYEDVALPIGLGQTISQPYVVAMMTQSLELTDRHKVLEIGTGSGYQAAILAKLARRVYTIERHKPLLDIAQKNFDALRIRNIVALAADGMKGWPEQAPFERIIATAAAMQSDPPQALLQQLAIGGYLVIPVAHPDGGQVLRRYVREGEAEWHSTDLFPVRFVPLLPDVARPVDYSADALQEMTS
ncbi:MAG: protein-L-isoaspartate(D-aspartate) O-methyltransferase [Pseudomonadota bacterium]